MGETNITNFINTEAEGLELQKEEFRKRAMAVIAKPLNPNDIKERDGGGGRKLRYISGSTVIRILHEAFPLMWTFNVVESELVKAYPKPMFSGWGKNRKPVLNEDGSQKMEEQPPYIQTLGRLEVPYLGIVYEQYGTKILLGGSSEQEGAGKSAATDAMKKCASLMGIGAELYEDVESVEESKKTYPPASYNPKPAPTKPAPTKPAPAPVNPWAGKEASTALLTELKKRLEIESNDKLDPYIKEFKSDLDATYRDVTPDNIDDVNKFLEKKIIELSQ